MEAAKEKTFGVLTRGGLSFSAVVFIAMGCFAETCGAGK
jgi:hypothetical protein